MAPKLASDKMLNMDLASVVLGLKLGDFTSQELVKYYVDRAQRYQPHFRAVGCFNPDALAVAKERDAQRANGTVIGPLHGIPILVKDSIVVDGMDTTCGSTCLVGARWPREAAVVAKLRDAGAIMMGKSNMSQWCYCRSRTIEGGWTSVFGQTLAPFHENQTPDGSSSGSAVGASLGIAAAFLGTETMGSIVYPANYCGVVGLKPTPGLTSRSGSMPVDPERDTLGPISRWVKDSAIMLQVIAGKDDEDPLTSDIPFATIPDYVACCREDGLQGMRLAVPDSVWRQLEQERYREISGPFKKAIEIVKRLGADVVEGIDFKSWDPIAGGPRVDGPVDNVRLRDGLAKFLSSATTNPHNIRSVADIVAHAESHPEEQVENYPVDELVSARDEVETADSPAYAEALRKQEALGADLVQLLDDNNCDLLMTPLHSLPLSYARVPVLVVPLGRFSERAPVTTSRGNNLLILAGPNTPFNLMFTGRRFSEETLIAAGYAFEQATRVIEKNAENMMIKF